MHLHAFANHLIITWPSRGRGEEGHWTENELKLRHELRSSHYHYKYVYHRKCCWAPSRSLGMFTLTNWLTNRIQPRMQAVIKQRLPILCVKTLPHNIEQAEASLSSLRPSASFTRGCPNLPRIHVAPLPCMPTEGLTCPLPLLQMVPGDQIEASRHDLAGLSCQNQLMPLA